MLITGAKGFAKELLEVILVTHPNEELFFFDDISKDLPDLLFGKHKIIRTYSEANEVLKKDRTFTIGVGTSWARKFFYDKIRSLGGTPLNIISPHAIIGKNENHIGDGVVVMPLVVIESENNIGKGTLLHVGSFVSHNVSIGEFCEISPYVKILGNVTIGNNCTVGAGAVILPGIKVEDNSVIGAGAVVTKDVIEGTTVTGVPAKPIG